VSIVLGGRRRRSGEDSMLVRILPRAAARYGDKPALVTDTRTLS
jgi:hypothetical protein